MTNEILVLYPHGLGDCILLTPALREYHESTGVRAHVATLERFSSAEFFTNNPHVDRIFYTKDAWHDYANHNVGFRSLKKEWSSFSEKENLGDCIMPMHSSAASKIKINLSAFSLKNCTDYSTEVHTSPDDVARAEEIINDSVGGKPFGFVQTHTGVPSKDLPKDFGRGFLKDNGLSSVIEIGKELDGLQENINVQFEILRRATAVCVPDSVFYHACHAMNKRVDFAYFARGEGVYNRVRPLHDVEENIVYKVS